MAKYTESQKTNALSLYLKGANFTRIEEMTGITRATLHAWAKAGELTDGTTWQEYKKEQQAAEMQAARLTELEAVASGERKYLDQVKHDLREIVYEQLIVKFKSGEFDARVSDLAEVVKLYNQLENGAAEKIAFGRMFVRKVMESVFDIVDEKQFAQLSAKIEEMQEDIEAKLNPLSVAHAFS